MILASSQSLTQNNMHIKRTVAITVLFFCEVKNYIFESSQLSLSLLNKSSKTLVSPLGLLLISGRSDNSGSSGSITMPKSSGSSISGSADGSGIEIAAVVFSFLCSSFFTSCIAGCFIITCDACLF